MRSFTFRIVFLSIASLLATGCASVLLPSNDRLEVITDPPGATARAGGVSVVTPGKLLLPRGREPVTIRVEKQGYEPKEITLNWSRSGLIWLNWVFLPVGTVAGVVAKNDLFRSDNGATAGLAIGTAAAAAATIIDYSSKKTYSLERDELIVRLEPIRSAPEQKGATP